MTTTPAELAAACRGLADELERGEGPELGVHSLHQDGAPCCAMGHVFDRAGVDIYRMSPSVSVRRHMEAALQRNSVGSIGRAASDVEDTNDDTPQSERQQAVIAPLRALADALDREAT